MLCVKAVLGIGNSADEEALPLAGSFSWHEPQRLSGSQVVGSASRWRGCYPDGTKGPPGPARPGWSLKCSGSRAHQSSDLSTCDRLQLCFCKVYSVVKEPIRHALRHALRRPSSRNGVS